MGDALITYLHDHLAGAMHAVETLKTMRDRQDGTPLADFATNLLREVETDRKTLRTIAENAGSRGESLKEVATWIAERASRVKLRQESTHSLSTFEALEFLELGIHGKWALWCALDVAQSSDPRLDGFDFKKLAQRAEDQRSLVDDRRLEIAGRALAEASDR